MQPRLSCAHVLAIIWIHTDSYGTTSLNTSAVTISNRYIYTHITIYIVIVCLSQLMVFQSWLDMLRPIFLVFNVPPSFLLRPPPTTSSKLQDSADATVMSRPGAYDEAPWRSKFG